ncbi:hypothetical protein FA15DRAFT_583349 [Coprinopsis marcescibilis]|uniref:Uncharacterized protein n=1 Tax=Coprinopsis marcescibilis TaxID=230819 RepID=A0A5C3L8L3_COPMA|nr:hypothetical protein FA15DRAFT_583349 [Coprinopsis marcescibilis]
MVATAASTTIGVGDSAPGAAVLALSDIIHTLSPSPPAQADGEGMQVDEAKAVDAEDESPEPLTDEDVGAMKRRLVEMGLTREDGTRLNGVNTSSREGELVDMVLRLIRTPVISPSQLAEQASAIGSLQGQLEFLSSVVREERSRWQSEREGWDRMAEALIRQRNKPGKGATPDEELERKCSTLEADNRILKHRVCDFT